MENSIEEDTVLTVYRLLRINDDIKLFSEDAEPFTNKEMACKIIPKNLMADTRLESSAKVAKIFSTTKKISSDSY
jgi:hypothetical protein